MSKHTPGPWRAMGLSIMFWGKSSLNNRDDKTMQLAEIYTNEADAKLIAAAPEMLLQLEIIQEGLESMSKTSPDEDFQRIFGSIAKNLNKTIAKARGDS